MEPLARVIIKERRARPFFYGHPWVFSGAVEGVDGEPRNGDVVDMFDVRGRFIARGFFNARSQICVRLLTWNAEEQIDAEFFRRRVRAAAELRRRLPGLTAQSNAYRLVHGESDGLPGLIVDRYADFLVVQYLSRGVDRHRKEITEALVEAAAPRGIYERSDVGVREKEGVKPVAAPRWGEAPPEELEILQDGLRFLVSIAGGQKTGFYLDQRENRRAVARYAQDRAALDCFCYTGAFSIYLRKLGGSGPVRAIDSSASALALAAKNAALNGVDGIEWEQGNVFESLRRIEAGGEKFDLVVLDPPKFAQSDSELEGAFRGLKDINLYALRVLRPGGILVSCSCSQHVSPLHLLQAINEAAVDARRTVRVLEQRGQAADHPVISSCPQTAYLKCFICYVE